MEKITAHIKQFSWPFPVVYYRFWCLASARHLSKIDFPPVVLFAALIWTKLLNIQCDKKVLTNVPNNISNQGIVSEDRHDFAPQEGMWLGWNGLNMLGNGKTKSGTCNRQTNN